MTAIYFKVNMLFFTDFETEHSDNRNFAEIHSNYSVRETNTCDQKWTEMILPTKLPENHLCRDTEEVTLYYFCSVYQFVYYQVCGVIFIIQNWF